MRGWKATGVHVNRQDEQRRKAVRAAIGAMALLAIAVSVVTDWVNWTSVGGWTRPQAVLIGVWVLGGLLLASAGYNWWLQRLNSQG